MNHNEIKAIAGVASIQTMIRGVGTIKKIQELSDVKIDGLVGPFTYNALNFIAGEIFGTKPYVPEGMYRPEDGILALQKWYEGVRTTMVARRAMLQPQLECDGVWGDETYNTFKTLLHSYGHRLIDEQVGGYRKGTLARHPLAGRPFIGGKQIADPVDTKVLKDHPSSESFMGPGMTSPDMMEMLAKAMGWDNPVVSPANLLASGYEGIVTHNTETGDILGVLVYRKPDRPTRLYEFSIVGIYVHESVRGKGIGTALVSRLTSLADGQQTTVSYTNHRNRPADVHVGNFLGPRKVTIK